MYIWLLIAVGFKHNTIYTNQSAFQTESNCLQSLKLTKEYVQSKKLYSDLKIYCVKEIVHE